MHFVLVHGAYHGAWCWDEIRAELDRGGHASTAVDLPCDDPQAGAERYVDEVLSAIPTRTETLVLVAEAYLSLCQAIQLRKDLRYLGGQVGEGVNAAGKCPVRVGERLLQFGVDHAAPPLSAPVGGSTSSCDNRSMTLSPIASRTSCRAGRS